MKTVIRNRWLRYTVAVAMLVTSIVKRLRLNRRLTLYATDTPDNDIPRLKACWGRRGQASRATERRKTQILIGTVLLIFAGQALAYPPDNAAVLYYRAFMLLEEPNESLGWMLSDLKSGKIGLNEQIRQYLERNRKVVEEITTAAEIKNCDWGLDLPKNFDTEIPHLAKCRQMAYILTADVKILVEKGDYKTAIDRCLTLHKMGVHVGDDTIIQGLVGNAIGSLANKCIQEDILPKISGDSETLEWLKVRLINVSSRYILLRTALAIETDAYGRKINREDMHSFIDVMCEPCDVPQAVLKGDDEFFTRAREYYQIVFAKMQNAYTLPYPQAIEEFEKLAQDMEKDMAEKPEVFITKIGFPAINRICSHDTRCKTHLNAVIAGIDIYLIRAKTGKLPDELPAGLPKDMFSGKDFLYEKTDTGFVLKCQGKDLDGIVRQFEFKVGK